MIEQTKIAKQMCHYAVQCYVMLCNAVLFQSPDVTYVVILKIATNSKIDLVMW